MSKKIKIGKKEYREVVYKEIYHYNEDDKFIRNGDAILQEDVPGWLMVVTAIPIIGTLLIIAYFAIRKREIRYEEV